MHGITDWYLLCARETISCSIVDKDIIKAYDPELEKGIHPQNATQPVGGDFIHLDQNRLELYSYLA